MDEESRLTPDELRRLAEEQLKIAGEPSPADALPEDTQALIHELRTHQIELEMQNDELRKTTAELVNARNQYSGLYNASPVGYVTLSHKLIIERVNLTMASMLGREVHHLQSSPLSAYICEEDQDIYYHHYRKVVASGHQQAAELRFKTAGGGTFWARIETSTADKLHGGTGQLLMAISDVSARKQAEAVIESERNRAQSYLDMAGTLFIVIDANQRVTLANRRACEILGYSEQELIGRNWFDHFLPATIREEVRAYFGSLIRDSVKVAERYESEILTSDGRQRLIAWHSSSLRDEAGNITAMLASGEDITEQREAQEKNRNLLKTMDQTGEGIVITDTSGTIEYINRAFTVTTGYSPEEAIGNKPSMLHSGRQDSNFYRLMWLEINNHGEWLGTIWNRRKNGDIYPERLHINAIRSPDGEITHYCGVFSDVSEQLSLEEQLLQAQKMESIGTLVGGIAHEFNNMLAGITSNLYLVKTETTNTPTTVSRLETIETQCFRAATMITQLLTFARKGTVHITPFDLTSQIKEALKLGRVSIPENIQLNDAICTEPLCIRGDVTQLQQIVINLLNNARDAVAFADKPAITLSLSLFEADDHFIEQHEAIEGTRFARLMISDNGYGIPESNMKHIFEPYFTTKEVGKGTGLGLAMVYGSVQTHHGAIELESRTNEGTIFNIYFPLYEGEESLPVKREPDINTGRGETLLLVDDNQLLRETTAEVLKDLGYKVLVEANGLAALKTFKAQKESIALIILDVVMPDMGGMDAAKLMRQINPDIPVIFSTGYDPEDLLSEGDELPDSIRLAKPVTVAELSHNIRSMLSAGQTRQLA
ncbi:PAS domain-containing hybrid sensor histidine kinase/response regulator [Mariprofundus ferrooxydans]|uniref:PAS domain-containing hybrid sensor histidine kinase/response regulator n=1 Tax=Mariprofundus ferrooxydans TaxID=314344 RepID=UPI00142F60AD|nr:PAS domain-containing sensor histidine kinase [Mariprofundus ferrooxydans]